MHLNKRKKEEVEREKKEKGGREGEKEKGKAKEIVLGQTNGQKDSHVSQWKGFEGPWGPRTPDWAQGPGGA